MNGPFGIEPTALFFELNFRNACGEEVANAAAIEVKETDVQARDVGCWTAPSGPTKLLHEPKLLVLGKRSGRPVYSQRQVVS